MIDFASIRNELATLPSDHDAFGEHRPTVEEIFTPDQHATALDPNTPIVVGARGTGKSFWAGVLGKEETRAETAVAYPNLGLEKLIVKAGYSGFPGDEAVSSATIDARIPKGQEAHGSNQFWQAVIIRAAQSSLAAGSEPPKIKQIMADFSDPEDAEAELRSLDQKIGASGRTLLVTFDALDTLSREWVRSSLLVDGLFEAVWTLRVRRAIRAKVFIRPEQLNDESLRFVELPKLKSGRVELEWHQPDLYGLLYWRLAERTRAPESAAPFRSLLTDVGVTVPTDIVQRRRRWGLLTDRLIQKSVMERLAGLYMGKSNKKASTYDWPYRHLGDASGKVTPRSFIKLFVEAAKFGQAPLSQAISAEGIRHGLREASKVLVDQLVLEYKWVKRALAPLAGIRVPCEQEAIFSRWKESNTVELIFEAARDETQGFLPPFPASAVGDPHGELASAMQRIGVLLVREDGRVDIPDLFRVAALMLKRGGVPPRQRR